MLRPPPRATPPAAALTPAAPRRRMAAVRVLRVDVMVDGCSHPTRIVSWRDTGDLSFSQPTLPLYPFPWALKGLSSSDKRRMFEVTFAH